MVSVLFSWTDVALVQCRIEHLTGSVGIGPFNARVMRAQLALLHSPMHLASSASFSYACVYATMQRGSGTRTTRRICHPPQWYGPWEPDSRRYKRRNVPPHCDRTSTPSTPSSCALVTIANNASGHIYQDFHRDFKARTERRLYNGHRRTRSHSGSPFPGTRYT